MPKYHSFNYMASPNKAKETNKMGFLQLSEQNHWPLTF